MRPTITQLRDWDTHSISGAGDTAQTAANTLDSALTSVTTAMDQPDTWKGQTHGAAQLKVTQEHDHADDVLDAVCVREPEGVRDEGPGHVAEAEALAGASRTYREATDLPGVGRSRYRPV